MSDETVSREAKLLMQLGKMGNERDEAREAFAIATSNCVDAQQQLREARDKCHKLRRERLAATRAYDDVCHKLDKAIESLKFIAEEGGKTLDSEYGDIHCNGIWCSDQAQHALYALEDMK